MKMACYGKLQIRALSMCYQCIGAHTALCALRPCLPLLCSGFHSLDSTSARCSMCMCSITCGGTCFCLSW